MSLRRALDGISGILVTPFDDRDQLDPAPLQPVVDRAIAAGVHVLVANGNTSEFYGLTAAEAERMVQVAAEQVAGRVPLLAGVGRSVHEACALARASQAAGAAAIMVHQPPDPFVSPRGVVDYVRRIAGAAEGLPLVLYLRNDAIGLAAIEELCALDPVVGVKFLWRLAQTLGLRLDEAFETPQQLEQLTERPDGLRRQAALQRLRRHARARTLSIRRHRGRHGSRRRHLAWNVEQQSSLADERRVQDRDERRRWHRGWHRALRDRRHGRGHEGRQGHQPRRAHGFLTARPLRDRG